MDFLKKNEGYFSVLSNALDLGPYFDHDLKSDKTFFNGIEDGFKASGDVKLFEDTV